MKELSVVISLKVDSRDRLINLRYLLQYFDTCFEGIEIIIVEQGLKRNCDTVLDGVKRWNRIVHNFIKDSGPHYKTRNLNLGTSLSSRQIVMMCDCDVLLPPDSLVRAVQLMLKRHSLIVSPHNGIMVELSKKYFRNKTIEALIDNFLFFPRSFDRKSPFIETSDMYPIYGEKEYFSTGGCILYRKREFHIMGGWNTNIVSYGFEDMEFIFRAKKLGLNHVKFINCNIYHLQHSRGKDSTYSSFYRNNEMEWNTVRAMTVEDLRIYGFNGFRRLLLDDVSDYSLTNTANKFSIARTDVSKLKLQDATIVVLLEDISNDQVHEVSEFVKYLEDNFSNYEINIFEFLGRSWSHLSSKREVKYFRCAEETYPGYKMFVVSILERMTKRYIWLWDFKSFIDPERIRSALELSTIKGSALINVDDELWAPSGVYRSPKKGRGIIIGKKKHIVTSMRLRRRYLVNEGK